MFLLTQRFGHPSAFRYKDTPFEHLDDAVWEARANSADYLIRRAACGVAPGGVLKYRIGQFEMG